MAIADRLTNHHCAIAEWLAGRTIMRAKKLVTALAAAIIMLTPITASAINLDVCQGTTAQQMTCTAHLLRSKGEPELAAQLEMIALQIERGLLTAREGDALAGKVIDARNRAISFETIGKSLEMIFRRTEPPPPPPAFRMIPTAFISDRRAPSRGGRLR